jgi:O-antigen/teichoic acid export membrane protein
VAKALLRESWPLLLSTIAIVVYQKSDQIMLPYLAGNAETGRYAVAARILELWTFVPMVLASALAPALVRAKQAGPAAFAAAVDRTFRRFTLAGWGLALGTAIAAPVVVPLLFGRAYGNAAAVTAVLAFAQIFIAQGVARNEVLVATGHTGFALFAAGVGAVINVGLNFWWIPLAGALGAAAASVVASAVAALGTTFCWAPVRALGRQQLAALWVWRTDRQRDATP